MQKVLEKMTRKRLLDKSLNRELEMMIWQSNQLHELVLEANLFSLYSKFNRGGQVNLEVYERHKSKLVDVVQHVLKKKLERKKGPN